LNNEEIDIEWINPKNNYDIVSKVASTYVNQSEYINKFLKCKINNINDPSKMNKELKNYYLKDLVDENNNFISDNKTIKKSIILQQVLINEMKKEIESLKMETENIQKKYNSEKENIINEYNKGINSILQKKINQMK